MKTRAILLAALLMLLCAAAGAENYLDPVCVPDRNPGFASYVGDFESLTVQAGFAGKGNVYAGVNPAIDDAPRDGSAQCDASALLASADGLLTPTPKPTPKPTAEPAPTAYTVPCDARNCNGGVCSVCDGSGKCSRCDGEDVCTYCDGEGKQYVPGTKWTSSSYINCASCKGKKTCKNCKDGVCKYCKGSGRNDCYKCDGTGYLTITPKPTEKPAQSSKDGRMPCTCYNGNCSRCWGDGDCPTCDGHGKVGGATPSKRTKDCSSCHNGNCSTCGGTGVCQLCKGTGYR